MLFRSVRHCSTVRYSSMQWWKKQESPCFSCGECQESTLWGMKEAQISSFTGVKNKEYFVNTINYCRAKYIKEAIEEIIKIKSIPEENEFSIYSEQEFVLDSWMDYPKVYLLEEWPEEDCHYFHKIIPSAAGFMHFVMDGNTIMAGEEYIKSNIRKIRQRSW